MSAHEVPKRVMHVCLSDSWGGLEMYPGRVTPEFQRQGWEVHGIALEGSRVAESFRAAGVEPLTFRSRTAALFGVRRVLRYLKRHDIRVMHAHKSSDMRLGALLVSFWPELRLFFTDHMGVKKPKKDLYHRWAYSKLQRLFAISQFTYQTNLTAFPLPADRITQLYCGIDLTPYTKRLSAMDRLALRRSMGVPENKLAIALPGRINEAKGHKVWVNALAKLKLRADMPDWCGVIIGEARGKDVKPGGFFDQLSAQIGSLGLTQDIVFTGFRSDLSQCLKAVDVVCIPSVNEAFGLSVIEAMAAGCAVIGSSAGAIPELISPDCGLTVQPHDPAAWENAIYTLATDNTSRTSLGYRALQWANERFNLNRHIVMLGRLYLQENNICID